MIKLSRKLALAAAAVFGLTAGAVEASSLKFYDDAATDTNLRFTLDCTGSCEGWILPTSVFSGSEGDMFSGIDPTTDAPDITGAADEVAAINARSGESFASITKTDMGGVGSKVFNSSAAYLLIAIGKSPKWALVKNLTDEQTYLNKWGFWNPQWPRRAVLQLSYRR